MKFYIAGKFEEKEEIRKRMDIIESFGHKITHDWTHEKKDYDSKRSAKLAVKGVLDCDFLVIIAEKELQYRGTYTELGLAIGSGKIVFIIGNSLDENIFVNHHLVNKHHTWGHFLDFVYNELVGICGRVCTKNGHKWLWISAYEQYYCPDCGCSAKYLKDRCDQCKKKCESIVVEIRFNRGSEREGVELNFCSDLCFSDYFELDFKKPINCDVVEAKKLLEDVVEARKLLEDS
ncbi:MAG: hypothetical protein ACTSRU_20455 [Candidatus Hodarchaeales archaeon]